MARRPTVQPKQPKQVVEAALKGNHIKALLDEADMTQEEAAKLAGISYRHFNRVVLDRCDPSLQVVVRLMALFDRPLDEIFDLHLRTKPAPARPVLESN